ncbi:uncharacterized protein LOC129316304 [Prosopis cineraria]|uniref:uncharacterized protein LOC129316304 n=1 Tax=Prosopis cineraria TaxID=364024 RepID=UPI00241036CD|nr:uncharacterized protein LOC129316304 [Prosopis cineraria]
MQKAKKAIKAVFTNKKDQYKPYTNIIQARWDKHLKTNLHATAYLLNPAFLYDDDFVHKRRLMDAMLSVFESTENKDIDYIVMMKQLSLYRDRKEFFDKTSCHRAAQKLDPYEWWSFYGSSVPELQNLAMRILSQTSSSSSCERNWSLFERIHTKRRNRLEHQRLNDLVFTNYNLRLKNRSQLKKKQVLIQLIMNLLTNWTFGLLKRNKSQLQSLMLMMSLIWKVLCIMRML